MVKANDFKVGDLETPSLPSPFQRAQQAFPRMSNGEEGCFLFQSHASAYSLFQGILISG